MKKYGGSAGVMKIYAGVMIFVVCVLSTAIVGINYLFFRGVMTEEPDKQLSREYVLGVNNALDGIVLLSLEQTIKGTNRSWGEMCDIVRDRLQVKREILWRGSNVAVRKVSGRVIEGGNNSCIRHDLGAGSICSKCGYLVPEMITGGSNSTVKIREWVDPSDSNMYVVSEGGSNSTIKTLHIIGRLKEVMK